MTVLDQALEWVNERTAAAHGLPGVPEAGETHTAEVHPFEASRRLLAGEPLDVEEMLDFLHTTTQDLMRCLDGEEPETQASAVFFAMAQQMLVGYRLRQEVRDFQEREEAKLRQEIERISLGGVEMDVVEGRRVPAHESFAATSRPAHGGHPGSPAHPDGWA